MTTKKINKHVHVALHVVILATLFVMASLPYWHLSAHRFCSSDANPLCSATGVSYKTYNWFPIFWRDIPMRNIKRDFDFSVPDPNSKLQRFKTLRRDPQLLDIRQKLMEANLWENPAVQNKFWLGQVGTDATRRRIRIELLQLIEQHKELCMVLDDTFMPYATADQISNSGASIHILDQANNRIPLYADPYSYCLLWLVLGPQGSGKSSAVFYQLRQIRVPVQILDPKGTWEFRAAQLQAAVITPEHLRFDFDYSDALLPLYLHSVIEGVAYATGLQYGLSPLFEACDIAMEQRRRYIEKTAERTPLCLKDIRLALDLCDTKNAKRAQYVESARTALDVLLGRNDLFATRSGLPLDSLFAGNYILQCRHLTTTQSRFLGWFLLNYLYFKSLGEPETTQLKSLIVFDDASRYISRPDNIFSSGPATSVLLHPLSVLRSSGRGAIFVDQLVEPICDDVKQLCNSWLVVGGMRNTRNQSEVASAMGLSQDQAAMLGRLQCREAVCFCPTTFPYAVHGFIPEVPVPLRSGT